MACLAVFALACALFAPTWRFSFLNWDDNVYVLQNPWIREVSGANLRAIFTQPYFQNYLPLHLLSYMLDYALWGLNPAGYHAASVLLHGLNAVLALFLVRRLSGSLLTGFLAALLFAVHPSHVEAVAWISSRKEVLSTTFLLLAVWFYLNSRRGKELRAGPYLGSLLAFLLGMLSKVSVVVLPGFLLLLDAMPQAKGRPRPPLVRALLTKVPYALIGGALILVNSRAQVTARAAYAHEPVRYLSVKGHAVWNYLGLLLGFGGSPDYDLPPLHEGIPLAIFGWLAMPLLAWLLWRARRRLEFLGVSWVFLTLLPALAFPLVTYMADRYLYAPSLGICWAIAAALVSLGEAPARRALAIGITAALALFFTVRTLQYSRVWRDSETLWTFALTKSRDYRVFNNMAQVRIEQKRYDEAERLLRRGAEVENVVSFESLGVLHYTLGRYDEALRETDRAIEIQTRKRPDAHLTAELHYNRGAILWSMGHGGDAVREWRDALRLNPAHAEARRWLDTAEGRR